MTLDAFVVFCRIICVHLKSVDYINTFRILLVRNYLFVVVYPVIMASQLSRILVDATVIGYIFWLMLEHTTNSYYVLLTIITW